MNIVIAQDYCDQKKMGGVPLPFDRNGKLIKDCTPEFLYSWQKKEVLQNATSHPDGRALIPGYLYLFRTPVGTVGYGDAVVEIKPRPDINWKFLSHRRHCVGAEEEKNTVYVIYNEDWDGPVYWTEYIICSPEVIKTWSFGTPEIKERMQLEYEFVKAQKGDVNNFDWFVSPQNSLFQCLDCWLGYYPWDTHKTGWKDEGMKMRFSIIDDLIIRNTGGVFGQNPNAQAHNEFKRPTYFLPESAPIDTHIVSVQSQVHESITNGALNLAAHFCDGKNVCNYEVNPKFIPDPVPQQPKSFRISWTCGKNKNVHEIFEPADATNKMLQLKCKRNKKIKVTHATFGENHLPPSQDDYSSALSDACLNTHPCHVDLPFSSPNGLNKKLFLLEISYSCSHAPQKTFTAKAGLDSGFFKVNLVCRK
jgi:hypothetical protein